MSIEANKAIVRRHLEDAWNEDRIDELEEYVDTLHVHFSGKKREILGPNQIRTLIKIWRDAAPDFRWHIQDMIGEDDKIVALVSFTGTHTGMHHVAGRTIPPTGRTFSEAEIIITRIANGKIVETWSTWDRLSLLEQLGATAEPSE
jgi:predicted ester cyclase